MAWNDFLFALVLIGKDDLKTLAIGINEFFHMAVVDWGLIMAAGVMVTIPALDLLHRRPALPDRRLGRRRPQRVGGRR